jgi:hypothetical protein
MSALETFLSGCRAQSRIISVTAEEPTAVMMAQIQGSYSLAQKPTLFRFVVESNAGTPQDINIIVPWEIWSRISYAPVDQLLLAANRFDVTGKPELFFLRPDIVDSVCLKGHEIDPIKGAAPELKQLVDQLKQLKNVENVQAYRIVDPDILDQAGCDRAVTIICDLHELTSARIDELNNLTDQEDDRYGVVVPESVYLDPEKHQGIVDTANSIINPK